MRKNGGYVKPRRYVTALRINISYWSTTNGKQGPPHNVGALLYWGRRK